MAAVDYRLQVAPAAGSKGADTELFGHKTSQKQ
jgi:hypothetical protein